MRGVWQITVTAPHRIYRLRRSRYNRHETICICRQVRNNDAQITAQSVGLPATPGPVYNRASGAWRSAIGCRARRGSTATCVLEMGLEALRNHAHRGAVADDLEQVTLSIPHATATVRTLELRRMNRATAARPRPAFFLNKGNSEDRAVAPTCMRELWPKDNLEAVAFPLRCQSSVTLGRHGRSMHGRGWGRWSCAAPAHLRNRRRLRTPALRGAPHHQHGRRWRATSLYRQPQQPTFYRHLGAGAGRRVGALLPRPERPGIQDRHRRLPPALQRNTFPTWGQAQPFRLVCHNGGSTHCRVTRVDAPARRIWPAVLGESGCPDHPIIGKEGSDSGKLEQHAGCSCAAAATSAR